jgi:enamine deaminase RidA (YjgF/YER057c/UK114 family)
MAIEPINPPTVPAPAGSYSQAVLVPAGARVLHISGQVGIRRDGLLAEGIEAQSEVAWSNVVALLREAGMDVGDLVSITSLVTRAEHFAAYAGVRSRFLGAARPASTAYVVAALVRPEWLVEVAAIAAKP